MVTLFEIICWKQLKSGFLLLFGFLIYFKQRHSHTMVYYYADIKHKRKCNDTEIFPRYDMEIFPRYIIKLKKH